MVWGEEICWKTFIWKIGKWWKDNIIIDVKEKGSEYCRRMEPSRSSPVEDLVLANLVFSMRPIVITGSTKNDIYSLMMDTLYPKHVGGMTMVY
jgi:hypothetical protein